VPWLIQLFHRVRQAGLPAKLLLIGDGPERPNVEKLVREIGLERAVIFTGIVTEVQEYLSLGDVFLLSSREESFGLAVLEAMACGVPVLAPRTGGLPEVVQEGGLLYKPGDLDAAEKALFQILRDLPTYRQAARQNALRFDIHRIVPLYEKLYQTILTKASILS
jgi:glycosyltransferase involved in cell wall biosynthesis